MQLQRRICRRLWPLCAIPHGTCYLWKVSRHPREKEILDNGEICRKSKSKEAGIALVIWENTRHGDSLFPGRSCSADVFRSAKSSASNILRRSYQRGTDHKLQRISSQMAPSDNSNVETKVKSAGRSWKSVPYFAGSGAGGAALMIVFGLMASSSDADARDSGAPGNVRAVWSILYDSLREFKIKMSSLFGDFIDDILEAGSATVTLFRCLMAVLLTASEGPTIGLGSWLRPGVAAVVADLAAHENRRKAVVEAGGGRVIDWLLQAIGTADSEASLATQAEAARALAHLLADESACEGVLSRPRALPCLFKFASSLHSQHSLEKVSKGDNFQADGELPRGRSMLVTAIMEFVTSSCDVEDGSGVRPTLPGNADPGDIAAALQVLKHGGWLSDDEDTDGKDSERNVTDDIGSVHGVGAGVLVGTGLVGMQLVTFNGLSDKFVHKLATNATNIVNDVWHGDGTLLTLQDFVPSDRKQDRKAERGDVAEKRHRKYGLWDDLQGQLITVPLAAWAIAMWARASVANREKLAELDQDGDALLAAVLAQEKTVKWHGAMAIRSLLGSKNYSPGTDVAARWSSALLKVGVQAQTYREPMLAHSALAALSGCVSRSASARSLVLQEGLPVMREIASSFESNPHVQRDLAQVLDLLTVGQEFLPVDESKKWAAILLKWVCNSTIDKSTRSCGSSVLERVVNNLGPGGIPILQAWLAMLLMEVVSNCDATSLMRKQRANATTEAKEREQLQNQVIRGAVSAASHLAKVVEQEAANTADVSKTEVEVAESAAELPMIDLLDLDVMGRASKPVPKETLPKVTAVEAAIAVRGALKALTELTADSPHLRQRILDAGVLFLLKRLLLGHDYEDWAASEVLEACSSTEVSGEKAGELAKRKNKEDQDIEISVCPHIRRHAARLLSVLTLQPAVSTVIAKDRAWVAWLKDCADGKITRNNDMKMRSFATTSLLNTFSARLSKQNPRLQRTMQDGTAAVNAGNETVTTFWPRYEDAVFIMNSGTDMWEMKHEDRSKDKADNEFWRTGDSVQQNVDDSGESQLGPKADEPDGTDDSFSGKEPVMDVVFIHGLRGGPFKTWRVADSKTSTTTPLVERIDVDAGKAGTCWPKEWLANDLSGIRLLSVKYKTNISEWSGATLPLQEVSSMLLEKLLAAGVGGRPLVFISHSMGGLVVKQMLLQAGGDASKAHIVDRTKGVIFYSCPHFGSKLADMPWRIGYVFRPAPSIGELRSGSPKLEELNRCLRLLHKEGKINILSFSETKVTPLVEGYGGWGLRMEIVPIESAYPGFGELVVLPGTDHVNSCKPLDKSDPAYTKTRDFLQIIRHQAPEAEAARNK